MEGIYEVLFHFCTWLVAIQADFFSVVNIKGGFNITIHIQMILLKCTFLNLIYNCISDFNSSVVFSDVYQSYQDFAVVRSSHLIDTILQYKTGLGGFNIFIAYFCSWADNL